MSSHLGQCSVLQCGFQGDSILSCRTVGSAASAASSPSSSATSSGLSLAMCTGGHAIGLRNGRSSVRVRCSDRSVRDGTGATGAIKDEVKLSTSGLSSCSSNVVGKEKKWVLAALAAMVMVGASAAGEPAMAFGWFVKPEVEKDPVEPFTLYGSIL